MAMVESLLVIFSIFHMKDGVCLCRFVWMCFFFLFRKGFVFKLKLAFCWNDVNKKKKKKIKLKWRRWSIMNQPIDTSHFKVCTFVREIESTNKNEGKHWMNKSLTKKKKASSGKRFMNKLSLSSIQSSRKQGKFIWKKKKWCQGKLCHCKLHPFSIRSIWFGHQNKTLKINNKL